MPVPHSDPPGSAAPERIARLLAARRNYRAEIQKIVSASKLVAFYGCGAIFGSIVETWHELVGRKIDFCCDSNPEKWGKSFCGVPCISPSELEKHKGDLAVFVTVGDFEPVLELLAQKGFPSVHLIYKYDLVSSDYLSRQNLDEVAAKLEAVRSLLGDDRSVRVFDATLDRLLDADCAPGVMAEVCEGDQYFPPDLIRLSPDEVFVDAGAFTGDTVADFLRRAVGAFDSVHCFELNSSNFQILQSTVSGLAGAERVTLHPEGLWNEPADVYYSMDDHQSAIGQGRMPGKVARLDDLIGNGRVTYLKMDLEGAERNALEGAKKTILANLPKLAVCVYHHVKDLWEIPLFINNLVPEYRIFLRHHTNFEYETVCYALPSGEILA